MPDLVSLLALPVAAPVKDPKGDVTSDRDPTQRHIFVPALKELELDGIILASKHTLSSLGAIPKKLLSDALRTRKTIQLSTNGVTSRKRDK